jgi:hypothetical protein
VIALLVIGSIRLLGEVMLSAIGQIFAFDSNNQQVPELQKPLIVLWAERAEALGYNVDGQKIKTSQHEITLHKSEYGWSFSVT